MAVIVVFGGTSEGRQLAEAFAGTKLEVHLCVATEYGASLLPVEGNIQIHTGRMDAEEMKAFFAELHADYCLDATHPYAAAVTENLVTVCKLSGLPYLRIYRKEENMDALSQGKAQTVFYKKSVEEAAAFLNQTTGNILITTGSKELGQYRCIADYKNRCFARVLPTQPVVEKCRELGFEGRNLIGMQGPFDETFNYALIQQIHARWLVTKNSGKEGGYQEKCEAALRAGANLVVIGRPKGEQTESEPEEMVWELPDAIQFIKQRFLQYGKRQVYLIGMGPGAPELLTKEAEACLQKCDVIIGAKRILEIWPAYAAKPFCQSYRKEEIAAFLEAHPEYIHAAVVFSGDIGFYSGAKGMQELLPGFAVHPVPGIASPVYFLDRIGIPWDQTMLVSCHGQQMEILPLIVAQKRVCALLGDSAAVAQISSRLVEYQMEHVKITVGERLSYPEERIITGYPNNLMHLDVHPLSVVLFENPKPQIKKAGWGIEDGMFLRGNVPMTKQEIRVLSLAKLGLLQDSVLYDIGAGTGSVSIEASQQCSHGSVYAMEKNPEAVRLLRANLYQFQVHNLLIIEGEAPDCMENLPVPTHAFIGGSSGRLLDIIHCVRKKNKEVRFVMNAVTLETIAQTEEIKQTFPEYQDMEVLQINASKSRPIGRYHLMMAENTVYIISFGGRKETSDGT